LTSGRFRELLDSLRQEYDFVVIDTPPLLVVTDPSVVAPSADGVILVVRMQPNSRRPAERSREVLRAVGAAVVGVVVNDVGEHARLAYGYEYSYRGYDNDEPGGAGPAKAAKLEPAVAVRTNGEEPAVPPPDPGS
jgi:Mrp family chromosome partitioning ATPase